MIDGHDIFQCILEPVVGVYIMLFTDSKARVDEQPFALHEQGKKTKEVKHPNGLKNGSVTTWYDNGRVNTKGTSKDDILVDKYSSLYKNGELNYEQYFNEKGIPCGEFMLNYNDGVVKQHGYYEYGKMVGRWLINYETGTIKESQYYNNFGKKDSLWYSVDHNNDTIKVKCYQNGQLFLPQIDCRAKNG